MKPSLCYLPPLHCFKSAQHPILLLKFAVHIFVLGKIGPFFYYLLSKVPDVFADT